jgi:hypothetical protein
MVTLGGMRIPRGPPAATDQPAVHHLEQVVGNPGSSQDICHEVETEHGD